MNGETNGPADSGNPPEEVKKNPKTTTISTIAVQSGKTRLVIALLQCGEWVQLKILEVEPELTKLGANLAEALELQKAHDEVLLQLQNKQSPVEELLRQADQLISTQRPRAEVYSAMAESLGRAWQDVNQHLELRKQILDLNVLYWERAGVFRQRTSALEDACNDSMVPIEIEAVKGFLTTIHELRRGLLEALMAALQAGNQLLGKIKELGAEGTLDSRPERIRASVNRAINQVEKWLDDLHVKRQYLEVSWQSRKTQLEQCLALAMLARDLKELEDTVAERRDMLSNTDHLGDSISSAELFLQEHMRLLPESRQLQERAIKITKATEQLVSSGCFAGEQATAQAYQVLEATSDYLSDLDNREMMLNRAIMFFKNAHEALSKLDKLEVELTTCELPITSPKLAQLHSQCASSIEEIVSSPLQQGHDLLSEAGRGKTGTDGIKMMVEELENRKIMLDGLCTAHREENLKISLALVAFLERQNELYSWLINVAEAYLKNNDNMGYDLQGAMEFMNKHNQLLTDLQTKGNEINQLLLTLPPILEYLDDSQRTDVDRKVESIHEHWLKLKNILETRLDLSAIYVRFHKEAEEVSREMDDLDETLKNTGEVTDEVMEKLEERWSGLVPLYQQAKNTGYNFISKTSEVCEPYLNLKRGVECVETTLERLKGRQLLVTRDWQSFTTHRTEHRERIVQWQRNMTESYKAIDWASKLDAQLYPIITAETTSPREITLHLENKLNVVLTEIRRAQNEVEQRIKMTDSLIQRSATIDDGALNIKDKLNELSQKLINIITDYQVLLEMLISYFKYLSDLEKTIESICRQYSAAGLPSDIHELERMVREHQASKQAILEMYLRAKNDSEQIVPRIRKQEPPIAAEHDIERMIYVLNAGKTTWEIKWNDHFETLEQHGQFCQFDFDLQQINESLDDLSRQLADVRGQYGESSGSAKATSLAFAYFEKTIELLQQRIQVFVDSGEKLLSERHGQSPHIEREINKLKNRWSSFQQQVRDTRRLIDLSIEYFQLIQEADDWFREGSKLLVSIARKSTSVKTPEEANELLNEIAVFLRPGEEKQNDRIKRISEYAVQLFGIERSKEVNQVIIENQEMLDSFTSIQNELNTLTGNLRAAEQQRERMRREQEEAERLRREQEEAERLRKAQEEAERRKREQEEAERRRRQEEEEAKLRREREEVERKQREEEERLQREIEELERRKREEEDRIRREEQRLRREQEELERIRIEQEIRIKREIEETERIRIEEERRIRIEREELERVRIEEENRLRKEQEEAERRRREEEARRIKEQEEVDRRKREAEEQERLRREQEEIERRRREAEEAEKRRIEEERLRREQEEADRRKREAEEAERRLKEEEERLKREQAEIERQRKEAEEAERRRREQEEIDRKRREEEERLRREREEAERKKREEEAERRRLEQEEAERRRKEQEEAERRRKEQEEAERKRREQEQADRRQREQEEMERKKREQEELERKKREQEELERKKREEEELERKKREEEERKKREEEERKRREEEERKRCEEEERKRREEEERKRREEEELQRLQAERLKAEAAERVRIEELQALEQAHLAELEKEQQRLIQETISFKEHVEKIHTIHVEAVPLPEKSEVEIVEIVEELPQPSPPVFVQELTDAVIQEGSRFTFRCQVDGFPMPVVTWHKDGISIQNNPDYQTTFDNGLCTLSIEETFAEDSARYTCKAINAAGMAETGGVLSVKEMEPDEQLMPPSFVKFLEPGVAKEGGSFQFECKVEGNPLPTVQWFKNYENIDNSPDFSITYNNGEAILKFEEVFLEDKADYTCKASNELGTAQCTANLVVEPLEPTTAPEFIVPVSNVMARAGQKIKLECQVTGLPNPELTWIHNGKIIKESRELKLQYDDNNIATLVISEAFPKDAGTYVVTATNIAGEATTACNVSVKGRLPTETSDSELASDMEPIKPSIQLPLKDVCVFESKRVRLDCVIVGQPEPEVIWYHDDRPVKESTDFQLLFQGDRCSLVIQEAFTEDAGEYKVIAINSAGEASSKCTLKVTPVGDSEPTKAQEDKAMATGCPPKFSKLLSDVLVSEGDRIILECCVTGEPTPEIKWLLNNQEIQASDHVLLSHSPDGTVTLEIEKVTPDDKGVYTVKASNYCGDAKCFAQLIVKSLRTTEAAKVFEEGKIAPSFKELFADRTCFENQTTKFECIVAGKPTPKVKWLFNGEPVSGKDFLVSTSGDRQVLAIPEVSLNNQGKITCVAENEVGKASCEATLSVQPISLVTLPDMSNLVHVDQHADQTYSMKREVFVQSSSTSSKFFSSSSSTGGEPQISVQSISSQDHKSFKQVNNEQPEIVESHKFEKFQQKNKEPPIIQEKSFTSVSSGKDTQIQEGTKVIIHKPTRKATAPRFVTPVVGKIVDQGVDVILEGILDGYPTPEVTWTKNGAPIATSDSIHITWELNHAKVLIKNVNIKDAGKYTCTAVNDAGSAVSTTDLVVKKTIFPPVFGRRLQAQVVKKGDRLIMEVEVTGTPEPTITWHKDNMPVEAVLKEGTYRNKHQGNCYTMIIDKSTMEHTGKYMVRAVNSGGEAQSIADIAIFEPTPDHMVEVVKTVVFEDIEKQEIMSSAAPSKTTTSVPTYKPVTVDIPVTILPETHKDQILMTQHEKSLVSRDQPLLTKSSVVSSSEFSNITESRTMETKKFVLEHKTPEIPKPEPKLIPIQIEPKREPVVHDIPVQIEQVKKTEQVKVQEIKEEAPAVSSEETGIETSSISKQSCLGFFESKIKENEEPLPPPKPIEVQKISSDIFSKFEAPIVEKYESTSHHTEVKEHYVTPSFKAEESQYVPPPFKLEETKQEIIPPFKLDQPTPFTSQSFVSQEFNKVSSSTQQIFEEFNLTPGPPPEIGFIPKSEGPKKKEVTERIKKLEVSQRDLSPLDVPMGAVKIFPTVQTKQIEDTNIVKQHIHIEKQYEQDLKPVIRPQADVNTRPLSPRPSAEGVEMEKLWASHKAVTPEPVRAPSPKTYESATLEKAWTPHKTEHIEHISSTSSGYTTYERSQKGTIVEPSLQGKTMEKMWAHKHADSHIQKVWPPPQTEETTQEQQMIQKSVHVEKHVSETPKTIHTIVEKQISEPQKQWTPVQTKFESSSFKEKTSDVITVPGPIHYVSDTKVTHIANVCDTSYSTSEHTEITKSEMRNENIIEETQMRPSEIIKSWPPCPPVDQELKAPQMVRETVPRIDSLPIRPVSVQDITDEVYLEPGPPPEIGYAEAPRERRQSYVESIEQDLEKNLDKVPSRVLPGSVRTIPPPRERSLPPPLPPKREVYTAPPVPIKPVKPEPKIESKPFEEFPPLEPFPFKPDPDRPRSTRLPPPPTPSKFIKGKFADSDYESDIDAVKIPAKWKPCQSDNEEPSYRKVKPPRLTPTSRSRSTEPEPLPPTKFDHPPMSHGPPRPQMNLEETKRELKKEFTTQQIKQIKKETKQIQQTQQIHKISTSPELKPGSPPQFICAEPPKKPDSPKAKPKLWQESGYMADTDEPFVQRSTKTEHHESSKTEYKHYQSSESFQRSHSMFETHSLPHNHAPSKAFHKHEHKKQVSSTALKKELVAPIVSVTNQRTVRQDEDYFKAETIKPKRGKLPPPPSPSKFIKGEFKGSDYESDYEGRIPPVWAPSDADREATYKPVRPLLTPSGRHSRSSTGVRTPTPPTEFDNPPQIEYPPRPKFEPIEKPKQTIKLDEILKSASKPQVVFKPKPLPAKPVANMDLIVATPARQEYILKPGSPPQMAYAPGKTQYYHSVTSTPYQNATQTETSNIMHFNESTEKSHRVVNIQQTTRVIKFGESQKETKEQTLEPFPFKPETERPRRSSGPPPPKPKKFVPGEFKESDYESEVDNARIRAKWKPGQNSTDEPKYRRVSAPSPSPTRSASVPVPHVQTPLEFDTQPSYQETQLTKLQPGTPPEYGYSSSKSSVTKATKLASKHMEDMTHSFKSTTQKFVNDIMTDMKQKKTEADDPQAYREESRVAEYGTKHIDPDTGLIYFKYDFGYEFGVILPGEGKSVEIPQPSKTKIQPPKRSASIELPVYHESTKPSEQKKASQARPKKPSQAKNVKWEPTSESEMSEIEGDSKKRPVHEYSNRWEQASASPVSLSPSLPSMSPAFNSFLASSGKNQRKGNETPPSTPSTPGSFQPGQQNANVPKKAPMFITPLRDIAVVSGQLARFECIVQSEPAPNILWSKNGRIIENSQDYQIQFRNGVCRLSIPQAYPEDAGTYTCTATNQVGVVNTTATLQVPGVPSHMYGTYRQMHTGTSACSGYYINSSTSPDPVGKSMF